MTLNAQYCIYKPNFVDSTKGHASQWEWADKLGAFFITVAKQLPDKKDGHNVFNWKENSVKMKLGITELADIMLVLEGKKDFLGKPEEAKPDGEPRSKFKKGMGLFHKTESSSSVFKIYKIDDEGFGFDISRLVGEKFWGGHRISLAEAKVLHTIFQFVINEMFKLGKV